MRITDINHYFLIFVIRTMMTFSRKILPILLLVGNKNYGEKTMLPNSKKVISLEFDSPAKALEHFNSRRKQSHMLQTHNIVVDSDGLVSHNGGHSNGIFEDIPLTDIASKQLHSLIGIPQSFAVKKELDPKTHAHLINKFLKKIDGCITIVVESDNKKPENKHIAAILPGGRSQIDDKVILERFEYWGLKSQIKFNGGTMKINFGDRDLVEVLPNDNVQLVGHLSNVRWGIKATTRPQLDASIYWKRLICSNGAYLKRDIGKGRLMNFASRQETANFVDDQLKRIASFNKTILLPAVKLMDSTIPSDLEYEEVNRILKRYVGQEKTDMLLYNSVTWWDQFNAITAAANEVNSDKKRQELQIKGGAILDRFLVK